MIPTYPTDCVQCAALPWWEQDKGKDLCRGRLLQTFVSHVEQIPSVLIPKGRSDPKDHTRFDCEIRPFDVNDPPKQTNLPVAGMRLYKGERFLVVKAKGRPVLVMAMPGDLVPGKMFAGKPQYLRAPAILVAPYYTGGASKYPPEFLFRARRCEYRQFFWDHLPLPGDDPSILRMDHIQPIGLDTKSYAITPFKLCSEALLIMDEWLAWSASGDLDEACGQILPDLRRTLQALPSA